MQPGLFCCQTADSCYFHLLCSNATEGGKAMAQQKKEGKKEKKNLNLDSVLKRTANLNKRN